MKEETKVNINVSKENNEVIVRSGQAENIYDPVAINISGQIDSPYNFLTKRITEIDEKKAHLIVNKEGLYLCLIFDETNKFRGHVEGKLEFSKIFKDFQINTGKTRTPKELAEFIKLNRVYFETKQKAMELVTELKNFKAKVDKEVENKSDERGNKHLLYSQVIDSNIPESFKITIPVFKGSTPVTLIIDINIDSDDFGCSLISPDAHDIVNKETDKIIDEQVNLIKDLGKDIAIINV